MSGPKLFIQTCPICRHCFPIPLLSHTVCLPFLALPYSHPRSMTHSNSLLRSDFYCQPQENRHIFTQQLPSPNPGPTPLLIPPSSAITPSLFSISMLFEETLRGREKFWDVSERLRLLLVRVQVCRQVYRPLPAGSHSRRYLVFDLTEDKVATGAMGKSVANMSPIVDCISRA